MGIIYEDVVVIKEAEKASDETVITVNCPDKTGLGCDLCRIILLFSLSITRGDIQTDGKWCYLVFWVVGKATTNWILLKKRLLEVCPTCTPAASGIYYYMPEFQHPRPPSIYLLKFWCSYDRKGLLHDVTQVLCELELTIKRVKISTTPDGRVMDLFFVSDTSEEYEVVLFQRFLPVEYTMWFKRICPFQRSNICHQGLMCKIWCHHQGLEKSLQIFSDVVVASRILSAVCLRFICSVCRTATTTNPVMNEVTQIMSYRELLHTEKGREEAINCLRAVIGEAMISCEIELAVPEVTACSQSFLPSSVSEDMFNLEQPWLFTSSSVPIEVDNMLSPSHTLVKVFCQDHKGLIYDIMRTLKDYNIQISYGRFSANRKRNCQVDLFIMQADGKKIIDPHKQDALCSRLRMELAQPLRVDVINRGPDTELLVANPVELSGRGRPLVFHDITIALKILNLSIFSVEIQRHRIHDREWEVYRILLDEHDAYSLPMNDIKEVVRNKLMGWDGVARLHSASFLPFIVQ